MLIVDVDVILKNGKSVKVKKWKSEKVEKWKSGKVEKWKSGKVGFFPLIDMDCRTLVRSLGRELKVPTHGDRTCEFIPRSHFQHLRLHRMDITRVRHLQLHYKEML